jgi:hypothetical protein
VSSDLSRIPIDRRRQAAIFTGLTAVVLVVVGVLPWVGSAPAAVRVLATVVLVVGVGLALVAWGLLHSTTLDQHRQADAEFDAMLVEAAGPAGACGCGQSHDPDELHITDACEHDGAGEACAHNCDTCVLSSLRR